MKIISKHKDFYDFLANVHGIDNKIVFSREDTCALSDHLRVVQPFKKYSASSFQTVPILIGNDMHLFYVAHDENGKQKLYSREEIVDLFIINKGNKHEKIDEYGLPNPEYKRTYLADIKSAFINTFNLNSEDVVNIGYSDYYRIFAKGVLTSKKIGEINTHGISYLKLLNCGIVGTNNNVLPFDVEPLPLMTSIGLHKHLNAEYVYQTLYNFYVEKNQREVDSVNNISVDNNQKITNAGFDTKTSFRGKVK